MNKFKIGDRVKSIKYNQEFIIKGIECRFYWELEDNPFYESDLELVQTSEQIAVEKFKEELKANVKDTINIIENSINPTNSEFKRMLRLSRLEAYEEVLKLLE